MARRGGSCYSYGRGFLVLMLLVVVCFVAVRPCVADDGIEHDDPVEPSQPGCSNSYVLVRFVSLCSSYFSLLSDGWIDGLID